MLTITVNDNKSITISSDDAQAENAYVGDALEDFDLSDEAQIWNDTLLADGLLVVVYPPSIALEVLLALEVDDNLAHAHDAIVTAREALRTPEEIAEMESRQKKPGVS